MDKTPPLTNESTMTPESSTPLLKRDEDLWIPDGNIVIIAEDIAFRLLKSTLARFSTVFRDAFAVPQPADAEQIDGCPVLRLHDSPYDLMQFFRRLFVVELTIGVPIRGRLPEFSEIAAYVRLGHKYDVLPIRDEALHQLREIFVYGFREDTESWIAYLDQKAPMKLTQQDAITVVNLARLTDTPELLPMALYTCCQLSPHEIRHGFHSPSGLQRLSDEDHDICMEGMKKIVEASTRMFFRLFRFFEDSSWCRDPSRCSEGLPSACWKAGQKYPALVSSIDALESRSAVLQGVPFLCNICQDIFKGRDTVERQRLRYMLPECFGLPGIPGTIHGEVWSVPWASL